MCIRDRPVNPEAILGTGLLLSATAAVTPMFFGYPPLTSGYIEPDLPLIGQVAIPSALLFDAGVSVIVVGLIMHILTSVGAHLDKEEDARKQRARERARALQDKNEKRRALHTQKRRERASISTSETERSE